MNGIAQMYVAFGRVLGPLLGSLLFAWSEATGKGNWVLHCGPWLDICILQSRTISRTLLTCCIK